VIVKPCREIDIGHAVINPLDPEDIHRRFPPITCRSVTRLERNDNISIAAFALRHAARGVLSPPMPRIGRMTARSHRA
jgi:hypothetical protein